MGRRLPCLVCHDLVGPCCGFLAAEPRPSRGHGLPDLVVCHICVAPTAGLRCQWNPPLSDFPRMHGTQACKWQNKRGELIFDALRADVKEVGERGGG